MLQEERVYIFLDGLDDILDNVGSGILQMNPFPTIKQAFAYVRREAVKQSVMTTNDSLYSPRAGLASGALWPKTTVRAYFQKNSR